MRMLILEAATAAAVAGETELGAALAPVPLMGGGFALPVRVLSDPAHALHHQMLRGLPTRHADDCEWPPADAGGPPP
jgi:hypothetical protein